MNMFLTTRVLLIGIPVLYLIGVVWAGSMYLSYGAPTISEAVLFGLQWPLYIDQFLS